MDRNFYFPYHVKSRSSFKTIEKITDVSYRVTIGNFNFKLEAHSSSSVKARSILDRRHNHKYENYLLLLMYFCLHENFTSKLFLVRFLFLCLTAMSVSCCVSWTGWSRFCSMSLMDGNSADTICLLKRALSNMFWSGLLFILSKYFT